MNKILAMGGRAAAELEKEAKSGQPDDRLRHQDVLIFVQAALQMATSDDDLHVTEKRLIKRIVQVGHVTPQELKEVQDMAREDMSHLIQRLSGRKARKALLLTLVAVALADDTLEESERKLIADMTEKLDVGNIDINQHSYEEMESLVLKFVASAKVSR
ncbi:MAG: hypothetical protein RRB13_11405 [bacterium]|nr:hypothetical protein [bacterium]